MSIGAGALIQYQNLEVQPPTAKLVPTGHFDKKLLTACQDFEAIFINQMLTAMRNTVPKSGLLHQGIAHSIYEDMLYQQYADKMAKTANLGLARVLYNQLSGNSLTTPLGPGV